ncbi:hypothetical protein CLUG_01699 [Clavispora lusitaniae ATCC 42720]|uniref:Uncharacterized protein n=1 Tax=Clavispora lusitaniae (strain ATCC 42720) TaxID=306902 RepID=C4Y0G7_CLAL4|nr:uncharacterized protein CLUG_01699 [Clavispora lusitaniae ATCC 42720]EEQ37576.1 hypothetical protein CLUG_01699 [Clavispora lusitaniae ATCC 42720]
MFSVQRWCVVCGVEPVHHNVNNPNSVKVGNEVQPGSDFLVSFEENVLPFDFAQSQISLFLRNVNQTSTVSEHNSRNTLWVPEQLINIIVTNNLIVVLFTLDKSSLVNFVYLRSQESVDRCDCSVQIVTLWDWFSSLLTLWRQQVVHSSLINVAKTFRSETHLVGLSPQQ